MQTQTEKKKTVREQMIAVGLQTVVVVVVVLLLFVGVVSGSSTLCFHKFLLKTTKETHTRADRQTDRQTDREFATSKQTLLSSSCDG
jgi:hypothetical protein